MVAIPFPLSSMPGERPGESLGRLVNCYAEKRGDQVQWRRAPGLTPFASTALSTPRGMIDVGGTLYAAFDGHVVTVSSSGGVVTLLSGALDGILPVTWSRNNKVPTPDLVVVSENGAFVVSATTVAGYPDADLPFVNSVCPFDNYHIFTTPAGGIWASDLGGTAIDALSFANAEAKPDGLYRGITWGSMFIGFGPASIEFWTDAGTQPFPLARSQTIPVGLLSPWAISGYEDGWDRAPIFVAQDGTVRIIQGFDTTTISTPDVERAIKGVADKTQLRASVYSDAGHSVWCLTGPTFTWCFDASTKAWFERQSFGAQRWRASTSIKFSDRWIVGDRLTGNLYEVTEAALKEGDDPLVEMIESGPIKNFPQRVRVPSVSFDYTVGQGNPLGNEDDAVPRVTVQWTKDGGASWSLPRVQRSLGGTGEFGRRVRVNNLGRSTHHGMRFRLTRSSATYSTFRGGTVDVKLSGRP